MKKLIISLLSFLLLNINLLHSQTWPKHYGQQNRREKAVDIIETYDKGYLICGYYNSPDYTQRWGWLIKTDINGEIVWEKIIENTGSRFKPSAIEQTLNGGILIAGMSYHNGKNYPIVIKLNACGEKEWCKIFENGSFNPNATPWAQDIKETEDGDIVVLVAQYGTIPHETIHLFKLTSEGEVLWIEPFATTYNHPGSNLKLGDKLFINTKGDYIISGRGYWKHPWDPGSIVWMRPMFIKSDSMGNEMWVLPFGLNDTIVGSAYHSLEFTNNAFLGSGYNWPASNKIEPIYYIFNSIGEELNYSIIIPDSINSLLSEGVFETSQLTETGIFSGGTFVQENSQLEIAVDCMLNFDTNTLMFQPFNHKLNHNVLFPYLNAVSYDSKLLSSTTYSHSSTNYDIFLAKLNLNLEYDTAYAGNFTYDSLCMPGPPQSGFIYLDDCDIITSIEMPSAAEYRAKISNIPINIYPNPAQDHITFALENTVHHRNIELRCFNMLGLLQHKTIILPGQEQATTNVSAWPPGMYIAVAYSDGKPVGRGKFVVNR